ncbi:hypothetical protein D3C72_1619620 [compost metagenome]
MADQDRPLAAIGLQCLAHATKDIGQGRFFTDRHAQWVVQLDTGELQGRLFDVGALEWFDAEEIGVLREQETFFVHADGHCGNFQQRVSGAVEPAGFYVHDNGQITTETLGHWMAWAAALTFLVVVQIFTHAVSSSRRQRSCSPARSGITVCSPNGKLLGAVQSSRTRVMVSVLRGRP